jgi:serine/threonine-protein kinase HipA
MSLDVYLHGKRIGALFRLGENGYSFAYRPDAVEECGVGNVGLSNALPVRHAPYGRHASRAYVEGLLPQGSRRREIADELDLDPGDGYSLIAELGSDCLGAVSFAPEEEAEEELAEIDDLVWLDEDQLEEAVSSPAGGLFDSDTLEPVRAVLPGERHKLALVSDEEGERWAWPQPGIPSTHIVKPEPPDRPDLVANEHACSLAYRELGFPVAHTSIEEIGGRPCLVSKRFDRWGDGPNTERLHQESFTQALGIRPDSGNRLATGTPSLHEASGLLDAIGEEGAIETLMRVTFCDLLIGCTELRGGNAGLLYGEDGRMLAPFYDIAATELYGETRPRPIVIGSDVPPAPLLIDIRHTIEQCEAEFQPGLIESIKLMGALGTALNAVAERAHEEGWYSPVIDAALEAVTSRAHRFSEESVYLRPGGGQG